MKMSPVIFLRWIAHNYSNQYAIKILKNLVPALKPGSRILINDHCLLEPGQDDPWDDRVMRRMDMVMLSLLNSQERTEAEFRALFKQASDGFVFKVGDLDPLTCSPLAVPRGCWSYVTNMVQ